ncbi:M23 family metallopeptidase [Xanthomonas axonopodis pv. ricini]|uniref:M23 family metallopeptidase n=1 Tax=Xanthomonas euvesicatoria TaxID=456327 RepID=UPI002458BE38|nr:M23 family metallopeptidase [Xanthomonas euvesicatoria]MDH4908290.1 M23 family metallopeptidase [Xanthomonas euvesicatoria]
MNDVPAEVLTVLLAVADDVQREKRARITHRRLLIMGAAIAMLSLMLLVLALAVAAQPSLGNVLKCCMPASEALEVLHEHGINADQTRVTLATPAPVTERYGINADLRKSRTHDGFDFRGPLGAPLRAGTDGVVSTRNTMKGADNVLAIRRQSGDALMYYHLSAYASGVEVGKPVKAGQVIGYAGGTSAKVTGSPAYASYAPHPHFIYGVPSAGQARQTNLGIRI